MFEFAGDTRSVTIGVVGSASVRKTLRDVRSDVDTDVSLNPIDSIGDDVLDDTDCMVIATSAGPESATGATLVPDDITELVMEVEHGGVDLPVLALAPPEAQVTDVLRYEFVEYLPLSTVGETPVTVLQRAVDTVCRLRVADYRTIYDSVSEPVTLHDPDTGEVIHANQQLCELLGYSRNELIAMEVGGYTADIEGYDQTAAMEVITSATESGTTVDSVEWPLETKTGEQVWVEATLTPIEVGGRELILSTSTDVTDRRRQRRQLEEITEHIEEVVYLARADLSEVLFVNDAYTELFGQPVERIYEDPFAFLDTVHPEDRTEYRTDLEAMSERIQTTGDPYEFSHRLRVDGEIRWVEVTGTPSRGPDGTVDRIVGIVRDVTEARQREREYEQIFHGVNDAIAVHDTKTGEIVDVNESYTDLYGYDRETILNHDMDRLSVPEEGYTDSRAKELIVGVAESGDDETVEWRIETADRGRRTIESNLTVATVGGQRRVVSIIRDITEQKRRERELEQIFNGVTDIIGVYHPKTAELLDVNETMCDLLGYDRGTILEADPAEITATELGYDAETIGEVIREVATTNEPVRELEWALRTASGDTLWIEVNATPAEINGQQRVLTIARDVTGRRDREERVEVFSRVLRHNFRNDIDVLRAYAQGIEEVVDHERAHEYVDRIRRTADGFLELSKKARTAERILRNDGNQETQAIGTVINSVVSDVRNTHAEATFEVKHGASNTPVETDVCRLVIRELIQNAAEHGGSAPLITISTACEDDGITITIADNGPGIPDRVLTPFQPGGETQLQHNHGLGLWLVNWGIRRLGGGIDINRPAEGGTTVCLRLPDHSDRTSLR